MKTTALILAALLFGLAFGLLPTGSPVLETDQAITLFRHAIRVQVRLSIEDLPQGGAPDTLVVLWADSSFVPQRR
jgi:hypothetical protein